ncbi:MAG: hypothetical protein AAGG51_07615 [Cyanobacteria bacterium P01_G01_bin.54]
MVFFGDALKFVGNTIVNGAIGTVEEVAQGVIGEVGGHVLNQITQESPENEKIIQDIQVLGNNIIGLETSVTALRSEFASFSTSIKNQLDHIQQEQLHSDWSDENRPVNGYITAIETQHTRYSNYATNPGGTTKQEVDHLVDDILDTNGGAEYNLNMIHKSVMGSQSSDGLLRLWTKMTATLIIDDGFNGEPVDSIDPHELLNQYLSYYTHILYAQARATNLLVEAYNAQKNQDEAKLIWQKYQGYMDEQAKPFLENIDILLWASNRATISTISSTGETVYTYEHFQSIQWLTAGGQFKSSYWPTEIRYQAEALLAGARAMQPGERRLIVHMIYPPYINPLSGIFPPLENVEVPIVPYKDRDDGENSINPSNATILNAFDNSLGMLEHYVKRFIFTNLDSEGKPSKDSDLQDIAYVLKDINGTQNLPPVIESGLTRATNFQQEKYLTYVMNLSPTRPFEFMDFGAYAPEHEYTGNYNV